MKQDIKIRQLRQEDIPSSLKIIKANYVNSKISRLPQMALAELNQAFTPDIWKPIFYVAEDTCWNDILGVAGYHVSWVDYGIYDLAWLNVVPNCQGSGIGRRLVAQIIDDVSTLGNTIMLSTNNPGYFNKHWKFKTIHKYSDDMHIMYLDLKELY
jgi:GNAT superfamily N-acetyltransferase